MRPYSIIIILLLLIIELNFIFYQSKRNFLPERNFENFEETNAEILAELDDFEKKIMNCNCGEQKCKCFTFDLH